MTALLDAPAYARSTAHLPPEQPAGLRSWWAQRRLSALWVSPLLLLAAVVHRINYAAAPGRIDDEGTYTAQAYAVERFGELAHYTYWYDHPPLGWLQIAAWTTLTGAFDRHELAVTAGREAMLVAHVVSVALLWVLARRLGLSRAAATGAGLLFALSPLAVQFSRAVYLDNVALPWLLAAFVLALSPTRQLLAFAGSSACFAVAVLSKETFLLLLPFLAWQMWRSAHPDTRRYTLAVASSLLVMSGAAYLLFALINSELLPGRNRVSLLEGVAFQLLERSSSGSVFQDDTLAHRTLEIWLDLDPVLPVAAVVAGVAALFLRPLRVVGASYLFLVLVVLRPGYLPVPYVIAALPFMALLVAGVIDAAVRSGRTVLAGLAGTAALATAALAAPLWASDLRGLFLADLDAPLRQAQAWIIEEVPEDRRLLVDDAVWVDLVEAGFPRDSVVWYYKPDTDPAVAALTPQGWRDYDYVLSTESLRSLAPAQPQVFQALQNSVPVVVHGSGDQRVEVRRVLRDGLAAGQRDRTATTATRASVGTQVAQNPQVRLAPAARDLLTGGRVRRDLAVTLAAAGSSAPLRIEDFPAGPGEAAAAALPRRVALVTQVGGEPATGDGPRVAQLRRFLAQQDGRFAPEKLVRTARGLEIHYPVGGSL